MILWVLMILGCMASDAWSANQVVSYPKARTFDLRVKDVPLEVFLGMINGIAKILILGKVRYR